MVYKLGIKQCRGNRQLRCFGATCEELSSVGNDLRDPLSPTVSVQHPSDCLTAGVRLIGGQSSYFDPDETVVMCRDPDSNNDGDDARDYDDDDSVISSHFHSTGDTRKSFASGPSYGESMDNFVKLDDEIQISVKLVSASGHNSSFSQSHCCEVGSTVLTTAAGSECVAVKPKEPVVQIEYMEYDAVIHKCTPVSHGYSAAREIDGAGTDETNCSDDDEVILLGDDDYVVMPADSTAPSADYNNDIPMKDIGCSCDVADAAGATTYTQLSISDALGNTENDVVNDENDGFVANKLDGKIDTVVSVLTTSCNPGSDSNLLTKICNDADTRNAVNCNIEQLVAEKRPSITETTESRTSVDICSSGMLSEPHNDALSTHAVNYKNGGLVAKAPVSLMETGETTAFVQNHNDLITTHENTVSASPVNRENDRLVVENSTSVMGHRHAVDQCADEAFSYDSNPDVDNVQRTIDNDSEQAVVSAVRNSVAVCLNNNTAAIPTARSFTLLKSADGLGAMVVSSA